MQRNGYCAALGSLPLRISLRRGSDAACFGPLQFTPPAHIKNDIIDIVLSCHLRWRDVFFAMSYKSLLPFMKLQQEDVPLLQSFHYSIGKDIHDSSPSENHNFWKMCKFLAGPNLRRFCAITKVPSWGPQPKLLSFSIQWKTLTHLEFSMGEHDHMVDTVTIENMLRQCLCLVSLKLALHREGSHNMDDLELPTLEILNIQEFGILSNIPGILAVILAPALKTLMYNVDRKVDNYSGNLVTILKRTPNLKQLILGFLQYPKLVTGVAPTLSAPFLFSIFWTRILKAYIIQSLHFRIDLGCRRSLPAHGSLSVLVAYLFIFQDMPATS